MNPSVSTKTAQPNRDSNLNRESCIARDKADPLAFARARFFLPDNTIYLDGNSLGARPHAALARLDAAIRDDWGKHLIQSWNTADWVNLPQRVGDKIAPLIGASVGEVLVADSTSVNLFKLLAGVLSLPEVANDPSRQIILSERDNFPTDLYIAEGVNKMLGNRYRLKLVSGEELQSALDSSVAALLVTQVDYRTGRVHNMDELNRAAARCGTHVIWDLSHSAGALPVQLNQDGATFAVGCGYKYFNGGPGAPGYLYVHRDWQTRLSTPLSGWFGHAAPFTFVPQYTPAENISRFQCGTPSVLATIALDAGVDTFADISMSHLREKSLALTDLFWQLADTHLSSFGFQCVAPREHVLRGSQLSFAHHNAYAIMQAIIDRGVIGDFRRPNLLRFGFTPLYTRFVDCFDAIMIIRDVMQSGVWQSEKYQHQHAVT
jgi:kynureninase